MFFDIETDQSSGEHKAVLVVLMDEQGETWTFEGEHCLKKFCDFAFTEEFSHVIYLSHYGGAFDEFLVTRELFDQGVKLEILYRENFMLQVKIPDFEITLKDSYLFIPTKLSNFPSMFGFEGMKTYFPHLFPYDPTYVGPYVDVSYYDPGGMRTEDRTKFLKWYDLKKTNGAIFNMHDEMLQYCTNDVKILQQACLKFRDIYIETGNTDPWFEAITLTHTCSIIYRKCFMPHDTIALIPQEGYVAPKIYSGKGIKWLEFMAFTEGIQIRHARNGGEVRILNRYYPDGYSETETTKTIFEFLGVSILM